MNFLFNFLSLLFLISCSTRSSHFSRDEFIQLLKNEDYVLISADRNLDNSTDVKLSEDKIKNRRNKLSADLRQNNFRHQEITGFYGVEEKSYFVLSQSKLEKYFIDLATSMNQESVILAKQNKQKLVFVSGPNKGKAYYGQGFREVSLVDKNDYSEIKLRDEKPFRFTLNFDFDHLCPNEVEYYEGCSK